MTDEHADATGTGRIGVLIDASDRTTEAALWSARPASATLTTARVSWSSRSTPGGGTDELDLLQAGLDSVVSTEPHIVVVAIESAGLAAGLAGLRGVERALSAHARVPVVTMGGALVEWLLARPSMRRVALVAPVAPWVRGQLVRVLREASLEVGAGADGPIGGADGTPEQVVRALRACAASGCDAVIQWGRPVSPVAVSDLAPWVGVPVVSSVHALLDIALDRLSGHVPRRVESTESGMAP